MHRSRAWPLLMLLAGGGPLLPLLPPLVAPAQAHRAPASGLGNPEIRVLLQEGPVVRLRAPQGALLRSSEGGAGLRWQPRSDFSIGVRNGQWQLQPAAAPAAAVASAVVAMGVGVPGAGPAEAGATVAGAVVDGERGAGELGAALSQAEAPRLPAGLADLWIEPSPEQPGAELVVGERRYRGRLRLMARGDTLQVVNAVRLEDYLPSVVGSEMPASWPQSALRAQAVVARTYALRQRRPAQPFDLQATVASQVYRGLEAETASTREAVEATRGLVLTFGGNLILAVFHSSSGGSTANSGEVWAEQLPYLVQVPDFDDHSPVREWRQELPLERLRQKFPEIGGVSAIRILASSPNGRIQRVLLEGPRGELQLSGAQLRSRLGLRSTWVRFEPQPLADAAPSLELQAAGYPALFPQVGRIPGSPARAAQASESPWTTEAAPAWLAPPPPPAPGESQSQPQLPPSDRPWLAIGRGFGHGVGMSQWGAHGLALRGLDYGRILRHYYPGTELRSLAGADAVEAGLTAGRL